MRARVIECGCQSPFSSPGRPLRVSPDTRADHESRIGYVTHFERSLMRRSEVRWGNRDDQACTPYKADQVAGLACLACGYLAEKAVDAARIAGAPDKRAPVEGDLIICAGCGLVQVFESDEGDARPLTGEEMADLPDEIKDGLAEVERRRREAVGSAQVVDGRLSR